MADLRHVTGRVLRGALDLLAALLIFVVLAGIVVFVLWALVALGET